MMTATARGEDFWEPHIAALRLSGQTSAGYAREHDLSVHALGWWRRKLNRSQSTEPTRAVVAAKASKFVALKLAEPSGVRPLGITMLLLGDVRLQMNELPPPAWLAEVSQAMRGAR